MGKFRKKPIDIEAELYSEDNQSEIVGFLGNWVRFSGKGFIEFHNFSHNRNENVYPGEWLIKGVEGEYYPCKASVFDATYEAA